MDTDPKKWVLGFAMEKREVYPQKKLEKMDHVMNRCES